MGRAVKNLYGSGPRATARGLLHKKSEIKRVINLLDERERNRAYSVIRFKTQ